MGYSSLIRALWESIIQYPWREVFCFPLCISINTLFSFDPHRTISSFDPHRTISKSINCREC
jgi:hypothetical protein